MSKLLHEEQHDVSDDEDEDARDAETPLRSMAAQSSAPRHRPGYARAPSVSFVDESLLKSAMEVVEGDITPSREPTPSGLGIDVSAGENTPPKALQATASTISRKPVGKYSPSEREYPYTRREQTPYTSLSGRTYYDPGFDQFEYYPGLKAAEKQSMSSLQSATVPAAYQNSQRNLLGNAPTETARQQFDEFKYKHVCHSSRHFKRGMNNWLAITIVILSLFSTVFSGAFLVIALRSPRYGRRIGSDGGQLTVSTAAFLTTLFAKMIELSFVTVIVAFIGQLLARRAFQREANPGITLAEISMRSWIVQPGTMLTHYQSVRYAAPSLLGLTALVAAFSAMLYTPAATALVQPQLAFGGWEHLVLQGDVWASFANENWLEQNCKTPITLTVDDALENITTTCMAIEHASQSFHNYQRWISDWTDFANSGNGSRDLSARPKGWGLLNDNTSITAPWIERRPQGQYKDTNWFVNNVTMAVPHPGVVSAALDPANGIMQPDQLNGLGIYSVRASVPVPFVNVLCLSGMTKEELKPLVYSEWDDAKELDTSTWPQQLNQVDSYMADPFLGGTKFDDVFKWGADEYGWNTWPPIFPKLPMDYNTLINDTTGIPVWGRNAVYVLGKGGPVDFSGAATDWNYGLCELRVGQTPNCSTQYNASSNVGTLEAICEDPHDDMRYIKSLKNASSGMAGLKSDWPNIASMWLRSINLDSGLIDANSSSARLWTELILTNTSLDYSLPNEPMGLQIAFPSPAEALAVMAGSTLIESAQDGPFVEFWNYSVPILDAPQIQYFNASILAQEYASGGLPGYQQAFNIVLFTVFLINVVVLLYFLLHRDWYMDFSDPTNMFSLAVNSPPSEKLANCTCGLVGNEGDKFRHYWKLENHRGHVYIESPDVNEIEMAQTPTLKKRVSNTFGTITSPVMEKFANVGRWRSRSAELNDQDELYHT